MAGPSLWVNLFRAHKIGLFSALFRNGLCFKLENSFTFIYIYIYYKPSRQFFLLIQVGQFWILVHTKRCQTYCVFTKPWRNSHVPLSCAAARWCRLYRSELVDIFILNGG